MPVAGRKPKPDGQRRNRHAPTHDWAEVVDVPFSGGPRLPSKRPGGRPWPARTKSWWTVVSSMPHCSLWSAADWEFAFDTAQLAAEFHDGDVRVATELRNREKVLGTTADFRRDLRIRYVSAVTEAEEARDVTRLDDYRAALG